MDAASLGEAVLAGQRLALARAITQIENETPQAAQIMAVLHPHTGKAHVIGVTGAPGAGKSTVVNALALEARARGQTVGIVAVDPTSPFSGGAILGDRIRMQAHSGDVGVFVRSMATRGSLGGLARATYDVARILDAAGFDLVIIETVGAGQSEVEIAQAAQTTVVIEAPGMGDGVQAIKAGILEIADVLVVNKADHPQADTAYRTLRAMMDMGQASPSAADIAHHGRAAVMDTAHDNGNPHEQSGWSVPLLKAVATEGTGIAEILDEVGRHRAFLVESGLLVARERANLTAALEHRLRDALLLALRERVGQAGLEQAVEAVYTRQTDLQAAVGELLGKMNL